MKHSLKLRLSPEQRQAKKEQQRRLPCVTFPFLFFHRGVDVQERFLQGAWNGFRF
jgi:hypothetical protein